MKDLHFEKTISKEEIPKILWTIGFSTWDEFERIVRMKRIMMKSSSGSKKDLIKNICRSILKKNFISDREYEELFLLVSKEVSHVEKIIADARKNEDLQNLEGQHLVRGSHIGRKEIRINRKILQDDHSEYTKI